MTEQRTGLFISIEGIEGAGKSTAVKCIQRYLNQQSVDFITTREPGGTPFSEKIRSVLLEPVEETVAEDTELLLMFASRAQHIAEVIKPALGNGQWVLCDRFTDASYAYQGAGRGIAAKRIQVLEDWVQQGLQPDVTFLLDLPVSLGMTRIKRRRHKDRIEQEAHSFFTRVRECYLARAEQYSGRYVVINAAQTIPEVTQAITGHLDELVARVKL